MNQSLTLPFDCSRDWSGSPEHADGAHHPDLLYHSHRHVAELTGGIVPFVSILWFKQGMAGFGELVSSVRWWTLIPGLLIVLSRQYQRISECGSGDNYCSTGRQPADWRSGDGYLPQPWRTTSGVDRPNLWRNFIGWRPAGGQTLILIRGWYRLWLTVRGALPYLLYVCDRDEQ